MSTQNVQTEDQVHTKEATIIVNGRQKVVTQKELTYDEVVRLAFPDPNPSPDFEYTVTYSKGDDAKKEGSLVKGDTVKVKEGMVFNVVETNKS